MHRTIATCNANSWLRRFGALNWNSTTTHTTRGSSFWGNMFTEHSTYYEDTMRAQKQFDVLLQHEINAPILLQCQPFDSEDTLTTACHSLLGHDILKRPQAGLVVLPAPEGAGKTSRVRFVCQQLAQRGKIRGSIFVDFAKISGDVDVSEHFWSRFNAQDTRLNMYDVMSPASTENDCTVVILDNVDEVKDRRDVVLLCRHLAISSANSRSENRSFMSIATCSNYRVANSLLRINDGSKVHSLGTALALTCGDEHMPEYSWTRRGLKWKEEDCLRLIDKYEASWNVVLPVDVRTEFLDLAIQAGTPAFVASVFKQSEASGILHYVVDSTAFRHVLDGFKTYAAGIEKQWHDLELYLEA